MLPNIIGPTHKKTATYKYNLKYLLLALITLLFTIVLQITFGNYLNSTILIASGLHTTLDAIAIFGAIIVLKLSTKNNTTKNTYGFTRLEIILGFFNAILLLIISVPLLIELITIILNHFNSNIFNILHFKAAEHNHTEDISHIIELNFFNTNISGSSAVIILSITIFSFFSHIILAITFYIGNAIKNNKSILLHSTFLHMLNDVITSIISIIGAVILLFTNEIIVDKIIALILLVIIIKIAIKILFKTIFILLESTPKHINITEIKDYLENNITDLISIHHIHIWQLNEEEILATAVILVKDYNNYLPIKKAIKLALANNYGIYHTTIELESTENTSNFNCNSAKK